MTSGKVGKSGLGAAIDAETNPELGRLEEPESDQGSESEPDADGKVDGEGKRKRKEEDSPVNDGASNQQVAFLKTPPLE